MAAVTDELRVPALHLTADHDRIAPAATAPAGDRVAIPSGHVGMIVGSARAQLHDALAAFLTELKGWRTRQDSNLWPLPSEGSALSS